jgi:hypothetical protein
MCLVQAGVGHALLIIILAVLVTVLTTMSLSAICTNGVVEGGGACVIAGTILEHDSNDTVAYSTVKHACGNGAHNPSVVCTLWALM